jgi:hypothetical protein
MFLTPGPFVYGALIIGAVLDAESQKQETFVETVVGVTITIVLVWLAHTYAQIIGQRLEKGEHLSVGLVVNKMSHEFAILTGAALPLAVVLIWWAAGAKLDSALSAGVWAAAITIVVANVVAGTRAKLSGADLLFQTSIGAFLGIGILVLKLVYH